MRQELDNWIDGSGDTLRLSTSGGATIDEISWDFGFFRITDNYIVLQPAFQGDKIANDSLSHWDKRDVGSPGEPNP